MIVIHAVAVCSEAIFLVVIVISGNARYCPNRFHITAGIISFHILGGPLNGSLIRWTGIGPMAGGTHVAWCLYVELLGCAGMVE